MKAGALLGTNTSSIVLEPLSADLQRPGRLVDALLKLPNGRERSAPTVEKTKRVLRMFLIWAKETGRIDKLPLPKDTPMGRSAKKGGERNDEHDAIESPAAEQS